MQHYKTKDYKKVLDILQENFGWSNTKDMSYMEKDLVNDTIKAVKRLIIQSVVGFHVKKGQMCSE